ncbi:elongation factor 1 beta/delta chain [Mycena leptocephala]|nr:elongation factor 1 beta/delta chain [Mycena leptocephala]
MANLTKLEEHLASRSYVEGYTPSQADVVSPCARWYTHIKSYSSEFASLPGSSTAGEAFLGGSAAPAAAAADDDDEVDLFGSDDEDDAEAERLKAERVAEYTKKKAASPRPLPSVGKSVRSIEQDGLLWGSSKLVAIGYGIRKLQAKDEKVSLDELQEKIAEFEDYVQSSDVAAMQTVLSTEL